MDISNELGTVEISEEVLCTRANVAATEIEGVAGLSASLGGNLKDLIVKKYAGKGISVESTENGLVVTVNVIVKFKYNVQDVALKVQKNVLSALRDMTNYTIKAVHVNIVNVQMNEPKKKD